MTALPVADRDTARREAGALLAGDRRSAATVLLLTAAAAAAATAPPWLVGRLVDGVATPGAGGWSIDLIAVLILVATVGQIVLSRSARYAAARLGERAGRRLRDTFLGRVLDLPLAVVERAGTGDLTTRSSGDVTVVGTGLRDALPDVVVASGQVLFVFGALMLISPIVGLCALAGVPVLVVATRWYLRRAGPAYLAEGAGLSQIAEELAVTTEGARTVEALGTGPARVAAADVAIGVSIETRMRTLALRCVLFPVCEVVYSLPTAAILVVGGLLHTAGAISLGAVVAGSLYSWQLVEPVDRILQRMELLQSCTASFARIAGVGQVPTAAARPAGLPTERGAELRVSGVHHAYVQGRDVLHGVDLTAAPGERLAVVGPSGAGKSTLGRLVAGIDPPRTGQVTVGGQPVAGLTPDERRRRVVMVTQEHHVFLGTLRDNLVLAAETATDAELLAALAAVDATSWVDALPDGLDTALGAGGTALDAGQEQQVALARVVLADPDIVVLDEATSLLDPATAQVTERSMFAVLAGRTVLAIAHRLHTAHDADRVAVMERGRVTECGRHDDLIAADGAYAALWRSWHGTR